MRLIELYIELYRTWHGRQRCVAGSMGGGHFTLSSQDIACLAENRFPIAQIKWSRPALLGALMSGQANSKWLMSCRAYVRDQGNAMSGLDMRTLGYLYSIRLMPRTSWMMNTTDWPLSTMAGETPASDLQTIAGAVLAGRN
jgi:hypothetical protein